MIIRQVCQFCLDDILVYSQSIDDYVKHSRTALDLWMRHKLYGKNSKCVFAATEVEHLRHIIGSSGVSVDPEKIKAIKDWPKRENKRDLQSFSDLYNCDRRFIKVYSKTARLLTILTENEPFVCTYEQNRLFESLKRAAKIASVLRILDLCQKNLVTTDSSQSEIGAVFEQTDTTDTHLVSFASQVLQPAEQNYFAHENEALALVDMLRA